MSTVEGQMDDIWPVSSRWLHTQIEATTCTLRRWPIKRPSQYYHVEKRGAMG